MLRSKVDQDICLSFRADHFAPVIDDRLVTPSSIVFLVVKVRLVPPAGSTANPVGPASEKAINDDKRDYEFLTGKNEAEEGPKESRIQYAAHAPHWPGVSYTQITSLLANTDWSIHSIVNPHSGLFLRTPRRTE